MLKKNISKNSVRKINIISRTSSVWIFTKVWPYKNQHAIRLRENHPALLAYKEKNR